MLRVVLHTVSSRRSMQCTGLLLGRFVAGTPRVPWRNLPAYPSLRHRPPCDAPLPYRSCFQTFPQRKVAKPDPYPCHNRTWGVFSAGAAGRLLDRQAGSSVGCRGRGRRWPPAKAIRLAVWTGQGGLARLESIRPVLSGPWTHGQGFHPTSSLRPWIWAKPRPEMVSPVDCLVGVCWASWGAQRTPTPNPNPIPNPHAV